MIAPLDGSGGAEPAAHTATAPAMPVPSRAAILEVARQAIERNLTRS
ncbi:hypothetical protein [Nonomuraea basaltis]|nr:hypothetical protein [Nonomuraea basaltis]